ncbi:MAG: serine hydrolase [Candidatus Dojkabacteria bacterium]
MENELNYFKNGKEHLLSRREFLRCSTVAMGVLFLSPDIEKSGVEDNTFAEVAQSYIADTHKDATLISEYIRMEKGSSPSNICGPLATSILLGWKLKGDGTISSALGEESSKSRMEGVVPREMWLGSPSNDLNRFKLAFPESAYESYRIKENIYFADFNNIPGANTLKPGDFLYLDGGSFTHYIAISRRDSSGRLYSVSNVHGEKIDEFKIQELMVWDPNIKDGFLREWAKGVGPQRARTGLKGFYLWRRKEDAEPLVEDKAAKELRDTLINKMRNQKQGDWNIYINEIGKGEIFEWRDGIPYHSASTIKVPLAVLALRIINVGYKDEIAKDGLEATLKKRGFEGRTFNQLLSAMLVNSEEVATDNIVKFIRRFVALEDGIKGLGMDNTSYKPRRTTQRDLFRCWKSLFTGKYLDKENTSYLLKKMAEYTENDDMMIGELKKQFPNAKQWNKRGIIADDILTVQDSGITLIPTADGNRYLYIGIAGSGNNNRPIKYEEVREFISSIMDDISKYIKDSKQNRSNLKCINSFSPSPSCSFYIK